MGRGESVQKEVGVLEVLWSVVRSLGVCVFVDSGVFWFVKVWVSALTIFLFLFFCHI